MPAYNGAEPQSDREGRCRLPPEDVEDFETTERTWSACPGEFGALAATKLALTFTGDLKHRGPLLGTDPGLPRAAGNLRR
jgi:hypothetical protein